MNDKPDKSFEFTEFDTEKCSVTRDGYEFIIDFSGEAPEIRAWNGGEYPLAVLYCLTDGCSDASRNRSL